MIRKNKIRLVLSGVALTAPTLMGIKCVPLEVAPKDLTQVGCIKNDLEAVSSLALGLANTDLGKSDLAQSFKTTTEIKISNVALKLLATTGSDAVGGNLTLTIESDNADAPSGAALASSTINAAIVSKTATNFYEFSFSSPVTLAADTTYWVRLTATYNPNNTSFIKWLATSNRLAGGQSAYYNRAGAVSDPNFEQWLKKENQDQIFKLKCVVE